ncbi:MAG TPA: hypothetical protein VJ822_16315 [Dongiaceae bacterium]|nr:hypothetical protein [Dongiaceae bacterium]
MLRPVTTSSASASSAPLAVHAGAATTPSSQEARAAAVGAVEAPRPQTGAANADQTFRYNSFEFIYRQDIGRIVLIGQSPETGERVIQVPSEQALQAYERTARVERQMERIRSNRETAQQASTPQAASTAPQPAPQLAKALVAAVSGANHGSGVVSVSA